MNIPKQSFPVTRSTGSTSRSNSRQRGIEASSFNVGVDRIQGGGGDFRNCVCTCQSADPRASEGGPDMVNFFDQFFDRAQPRSGVPRVFIGGNRSISDNNNV
jgi:hypothetical protein